MLPRERVPVNKFREKLIDGNYRFYFFKWRQVVSVSIQKKTKIAKEIEKYDSEAWF